MKLGAFSILFNDISIDKVLDTYQRLGLSCIELGAAAYSRSNHIILEELYHNAAACKVYKKQFDDHHIAISALSTSGNPIHPDKEIAQLHHKGFEMAVEVAAELGVKTVNVLSGVPGGSPEDKTPNWIVSPWPEDFAKAYQYQWNDILIPYWYQANKFAKKHGVQIAMEPHPNFCVYNLESMLLLRKEAGENLGCNLDPSHLIWQGADPCEVIRRLDKAIFHFHAKDIAIHKRIVMENGILDPKPYQNFKERSWNFRSCGYGNSEKLWKDIMASLAEIGYDGTISIEYEDGLIGREEGISKVVRFLNEIIIHESVKTMWWEMRSEG